MISAFELRRQIFHLMLGFVMIILIYFSILTWQKILLLIIMGFFLAFISRRFKIPIIHRLLDMFEREKNLKRFPGIGVMSFLIGVFLSVVLFPKDIMLASLMILTLGDSIAPLVGPFGRVKHPLSKVKLLEGSIAGMIAGGLGAMFFVPAIHAFAASVIAMTVETAETGLFKDKIDDNILIPILAGAVMTLLA